MFFTPFASAQEANLNAVATAAGFGQSDLLSIIGNIINVFLGLLGVIFLLLVIYAGYLWMTSSGNEETIAKAKNILKSAIIGIIICLAAYAIATFIINTLLQAVGLGGSSVTEEQSTEAFSDALGSGGIEDHYPGRNATGIARNTKIIVTFKNQIYIPSFIVGYDTGQEASDVSDDVPPATAYVNTDNFTLTCVDQNSNETTYASDEILVAFTDDLKTFTFDPPVMGSAVAPTDCTVTLSQAIKTVSNGDAISEKYQWSFQVSTELDTTPPTVVSVVPPDGASGYGRNIIIQITFSEAVDPTTASGTYDAVTGGFNKIQTSNKGVSVSGTYDISSGYTIVEFGPAEACGENSCGQIVYCLPGPADATSEEPIGLKILAADVGSAPPEATIPYTGVADVAGNALDGLDDGTFSDYSESFSVTDDIVLTPPHIDSVEPTVKQEEINTDAPLNVFWDTLMRASTMTNSVVSVLANPDHDLWYSSSMTSLNADEPPVDVRIGGGDPTTTELTIDHGIFLQSSKDDPSTPDKIEPTVNYTYWPVLPDEIQSLYQNCFYPVQGPGVTETDTCYGAPNCCNGTSSISGFDAVNFKCQL